jgi:CelD/BcsL family acetyltransferase involved in cellulose biosynthesis
MPVKLARSVEAAEMLKNKGFRARWLRLYEECPWATPAQSPAFVSSWYDAYKEQYLPLLVSEFSLSNDLIGLLPLALDWSGHAVSPGGRQAEYKSWLALPSNGRSFLQASLKLLSRKTQIGALFFHYLSAGAPVEGAELSSAFSWISEVETHRRPIIRLGDAGEVTEYICRKTNKTIKNSWNRLKRIGNVRLEQIRYVDELVPIFDQLIAWYDLRQERAHGKRPFQLDRYKKIWHLSLLKEGLLHVTLLKTGNEVVSAIFGLSDGKTYSLMMSIFAPDYARYSPVALHHLLLVEHLHAEGYSILDLTPGSDPFKERFAGAYEDVRALSVYFKHREWIKAKVRQQSEVLARGLLSAVGITPGSIARTLPRGQAFLKALLRFKKPSRESPHMAEPI